eukprot:98351-Pleurochrysis_carterae.AAC.1
MRAEVGTSLVLENERFLVALRLAHVPQWQVGRARSIGRQMTTYLPTRLVWLCEPQRTCGRPRHLLAISLGRPALGRAVELLQAVLEEEVANGYLEVFNGYLK